MRPIHAHFVTFDTDFSVFVEREVLPHLMWHQVKFDLLSLDSVSNGFKADIERGDIFIPCASWRLDPAVAAIRLLQMMEYDCALMIWAKPKHVWQTLSKMHKNTPIRFLVEIAAPGDTHQLFPGLDAVSATGLAGCGGQIATFIWEHVDQIIAAREQDLPSMRPYAA